jgi:hypothetical protein
MKMSHTVEMEMLMNEKHVMMETKQIQIVVQTNVLPTLVVVADKHHLLVEEVVYDQAHFLKLDQMKRQKLLKILQVHHLVMQ